MGLEAPTEQSLLSSFNVSLTQFTYSPAHTLIYYGKWYLHTQRTLRKGYDPENLGQEHWPLGEWYRIETVIELLGAFVFLAPCNYTGVEHLATNQENLSSNLASDIS